jgi:hypothetical protein
MYLAAGFAPHTGRVIAEVAFLLFVIAGVWLVAAEVTALKMSATRRVVADVLIAAAGVPLIIVVHWGHFG